MTDVSDQIDPAPARSIKDFEALHSRQVTFNEYRILNLSDDDNTAYEVDVEQMTCSCSDQAYNRSEGEVCKHLAYALYKSPEKRQAEEHTLRQIASVTQELNAAARQAKDAASQYDESLVKTRSQQADQVGDTDDSDDDERDGLVHDSGPSTDQAELMDDLKSWFNQAAGFNGFDPEIIELTWSVAEGHQGVVVDTVPWNGDDPYYDDGEWVDKDGFDEESETVKDSILSPRTEFNWYGEPDYSWFIHEDDIEKVIE